MKKSRVASRSVSLRFEQRLVLHQWMLSLLGVPSFERLAANLKAPELEGFDEDKDQEYDVIYVNGDNNLENLRKADQTWKVRLIEEEFRRLMFDVQDV
jgi:hypothetical protein